MEREMAAAMLGPGVRVRWVGGGGPAWNGGGDNQYVPGMEGRIADRGWTRDDDRPYVDGDGDTYVIWDDHRFNDQAYTDNTEEGAWVYEKIENLELAPTVNINDITEIEKFLNN